MFPACWARLPRRGYLIPFIALSLDAVFRCCFGVLSPLHSMLPSFQGNSKRFKAFHFNPEEAALQHVSVSWCDWKGEPQGVVTPVPSVHMVSTLRWPGHKCRHVHKWEALLAQHPKQDEILSYIKYKINVRDFFIRFRGDFQGTFYDSPCPPRAEFSNNKSFLDFEDFISSFWIKICSILQVSGFFFGAFWVMGGTCVRNPWESWILYGVARKLTAEGLSLPYLI